MIYAAMLPLKDLEEAERRAEAKGGIDDIGNGHSLRSG